MPSTAVLPHHGNDLTPPLEHATVADAIRPQILSRDPETSLSEVARMMAAGSDCHLVVEDPDGQRIAILSALDIAGVRAWGDG
jgi:CBS domain-containing protein